MVQEVMTRRTAPTGARPLVFSLTLALAFLGSALGGTFTATPASAADDPAGDGMWYFTATGISAAQKTTTGAGITIALLDGPINPGAPDLVGTNLIARPKSFCEDKSGALLPATATTENAERATTMASLIVGTGAGIGGQPGTLGVAPGATLRHYTIQVGDAPCVRHGSQGMAAAIDQAVADGAKIITTSVTYKSLDAKTLAAITRAERAGVILVAALSNEAKGDPGWPVLANGVLPVEGADTNMKSVEHKLTTKLPVVQAPGVAIHSISWSDGRWDTYRLDSSSADAAAWTAGVLALSWSGTAGASSNDVIWYLKEGTKKNDEIKSEDITWGGDGGMSAWRASMQIWPVTDTNPLLRKDAGAKPAYTDIVDAKTQVSATAHVSAKHRAAESKPLIVLAGLVALLVLFWIVQSAIPARRNRSAAEAAAL